MRIAIVTTDVREDRHDYSSPIATFGTAPTALLEGFAGIPEIEVHVLSCVQQRVRSQEKLAPNIWVHSLYVPRVGWMRTLYQGCVRAVRRKLRELRPDIVHGQGTERDCALDASFSGIPNVVTIHGNMRVMAQLARARPPSYSWLAAKLERVAIPRTHGVVCITRYTQEAVSGLARRTWVVPNAVENSFFEIVKDPPRGSPSRVLVVGVISPRKNQNAFICALDGLAKTSRFDVLFLGQGPSGDPYVSEFHRLVKLRPWCSCLGFASREQLKNHLRQASVLALPSLEDNCPMVVLEAMAAGVPVVAARVGGVPELIEHETTGLFCDPLDPLSMSAQIEAVLARPETAQAMAERAKVAALERFHPRVIARKHVQIYREILAAA